MTSFKEAYDIRVYPGAAETGTGVDDEHSLPLPDGAQLTWARAIMAEVPPSGTGRGLSLSWVATQPGTGTPLIWADEPDLTWAYFGGQHPRTVSSEALSPSWIRRLLIAPETARQLSGVFSLVVLDKKQHTLLAVGDRLGIQGLHYGRDRHGAWQLSTHLTWLLLALGHDGSVDDRSFKAHLAFGYAVDPHREVYRNVHVVRPGGCVRLTETTSSAESYWKAPEPSAPDFGEIGALVAALQSATYASADRSHVFLGLTAGKDSLCLASAIPDGCAPHTGTLGAAECADLLQGKELARVMHWPHVSAGVCGPAEFFRWAEYVAFHSAGLATTSYADMAAFVARRVPIGCAFVMGEGGECVRDFFKSPGRSAMQTLLEDYMTPRPYLAATLAPRLADRLHAYPADLVDPLCAMSGTRDADEFLSSFYRMQRMPGNFSLRHAILSAVRPKISPFLDSRFIDAAYHVSTAEHVRSRLHWRVISHARPALLPFFESPIKSDRGTQDWPARFPRLAHQFRQLLVDGLPHCDDVLNRDGVLTLCDATAARPSRAIYHLFRVFSFVRARAMLRTCGAERLQALEEKRLTVSQAP